MRYPLWAFFFVLVLPPFAAHALLTGKAQMTPRPQFGVTAMLDAPAQSNPYWQHVVITR
jgi:hypothetical protein